MTKNTRHVMSEDVIETVINQTLDGALGTIPMYLQEIEQNKDEIKTKDPKEFVYGLVMGMALSMASAMVTAQSGNMPTEEEQNKVRELVYKKIPDIRSRIFNE